MIAILAGEGEDVADAAKGGGDGGGAGAAQSGDGKGGAMAENAKADAAATGSVEEAKEPEMRGDSRPAGGNGAAASSAAGAKDGGAKDAGRKAAEIGSSPRRSPGGWPRRRARPLRRERLRPARPRRQGRHRMPRRRAAREEAGRRRSAEGRRAPRPPAAAPIAKAASDESIMKLFQEGSYEKIPHDGMRKTIAKRLVEAKTTIPHFYLTLDCELDALLALRTQLNKASPMIKTPDGEKPAYKLSVNDMIIKGLALALKAVPDANVSWTEAAMLKHKHADVGVAVSIEGGLITPIIRRADEKTLSAISNEMKDLAKRARTRKLKPEEYQGGTSAVSNLGMFGIKDFSAVINPPHATILAVGAGEERAVVKNGAVTVATVMSATLSTDHRAVDGVLGAELLSAFKQLIENPMSHAGLRPGRRRRP